MTSEEELQQAEVEAPVKGGGLVDAKRRAVLDARADAAERFGLEADELVDDAAMAIREAVAAASDVIALVELMAQFEGVYTGRELVAYLTADAAIARVGPGRYLLKEDS
jgi:hypothetical protein